MVDSEVRRLGVPCDGVGINIVDEDAESLSIYDRATERFVPRRWREEEEGRAFAGDLTGPFWEYWRQHRTWVRHWPLEHEQRRVQWDAKHGHTSQEAAEKRLEGLHPDGNYVVDVPFTQGILAMSRSGSEPALHHRRSLSSSGSSLRGSLAITPAGLPPASHL